MLNVPKVVVTLAEIGCATHSAGITNRYPARQAAEVVDTTGASDAFSLALQLTLGAS